MPAITIWLHIFVCWPDARAALVNDRLAHRLEQRPHALERPGVAAGHDRQRRVARADVAARHRRIERLRASALAAACAISTASDGSVVVMSTSTEPARVPGEHAVLGEVDVAHVGGKAHHREDDVGLLRRAARGDPTQARAAIEQRLRLVARPREHGDARSAAEQVPAHREPHHAGADPGDAEGGKVAHADEHYRMSGPCGGECRAAAELAGVRLARLLLRCDRELVLHRLHPFDLLRQADGRARAGGRGDRAAQRDHVTVGVHVDVAALEASTPTKLDFTLVVIQPSFTA